jgi:hypothetical protein
MLMPQFLHASKAVQITIKVEEKFEVGIECVEDFEGG